ncbi:hypothetical protein DKL61_15125 [Gammaproteobacteria bacterium ESL0073]|nr:hypothetical protein DKL61_15125 [Gammaproteobacteria bacterium ESL0073]
MAWFIGLFIIIVIIFELCRPRRCDICKLSFNKKYHTWSIEGKKQHLCPNCNSKMTRRISSQRFNKRFGK